MSVTDRLLVPYWNNDDLYVAALDPQNGALAASVYLCTLPEGEAGVPHGLSPAMDDQYVFIPTNAGLLLALDTRDLSLRWAARYERHALGGQASMRELLAPDDSSELPGRQGWLPGPPIVAGSLVLLAPLDSEYLYAFDRTTVAGAASSRPAPTRRASSACAQPCPR